MRAFKTGPKLPLKPALFLDRDGVLIKDREGFYLIRPEQIKFYSSAVKALKKIKGYRLIVLTNQSSINRGYISLKKSVAINLLIRKKLREKGIIISGIYFCPHTPEENCSCRKPKTGLLKEAVKDFKTDLKNSFLAGDKKSDMDLAGSAGVKGIFVLTGQGPAQEKKYKINPDFRIKNLRGLEKILKNHEKQNTHL